MVEIRRFIKETAIALGCSSDAAAELVLAMNEAVTNILVHGYDGRVGWIEIAASREDGAVFFHLRDLAPPFDPTMVPPPDITLPLEKREPGGVGVPMMREFTNELHYRVRHEGGNELTFVKLI